MAVHLDARLNTRFIPILFSVALALIVASAAVHAHASGDLSQSAAQDQIQTQVQEPLEAQDTPREELRELMENAKPERVDRRPGFSPISLVPAKDEPVAEVTEDQR
jgi:hypothetical protein